MSESLVGTAKFIIVTGGVISGVGKGILSSSIAALLEMQGYKVAVMKIDPYLNVDAGTMRPTEHGEVFVTEDGFETDQDLGNYERFTSISTSKDSSVTTGQVYLQVIQDERAGRYDGKCVEVIPHIPLEVIKRIRLVAEKNQADFVIVEIGATAGEYQILPFLEAVRRMKFSGEEVKFVHIGYLPIPGKIGEQKTKPIQRSIFDLLSCGIKPDFVVCRSEKPVDGIRKRKIALNCNVKEENIISAPDIGFVYEVPLNFNGEGFDKKLLAEFNLPFNPEARKLIEWKQRMQKINNFKRSIKIGVVGKYFDIGDFTLEDSYISVLEAVKHAAWLEGFKPEIKWIDSKAFEKNIESLACLNEFDGIIVPGGFGSSGVEGKINAIKYCREQKIPFLGLCYGLQLAVIEFSRNIAGLKQANSTELDRNAKQPVIDILPEQKKNLNDKNFGASMRLGAFQAKLKQGTIVRRLYAQELISERHRHRWECNNAFMPLLEKHGLIVSGINPERNLVEFIELPETKHPFFLATQSHPEFKSRFLQPSPVFIGLIKAAIQRKNSGESISVQAPILKATN